MGLSAKHTQSLYIYVRVDDAAIQTHTHTHKKFASLAESLSLSSRNLATHPTADLVNTVWTG